MRHRNIGRQLSRDSSARKAVLRSLAQSLFRHELITPAKKDSLAHRRLAFDRLRDREMVTKLFKELGPRYARRPGGYLRILKRGFRRGDCAPLAIVELVDRPVPPPAAKA